MAASDYTIRAEGTLAASGVLVAAIEHLDEEIEISGFRGTPPIVGMAAMIGPEIVRIVAINLPNLTIARGCADTIPASHAAGTRIWLLSTNIPRDNREYPAGSTIGVKGLPFTLSGGAVPISNAPPMSLTFNWRFVRPYPPGKFECGGTAWCNGPFILELGEASLSFTWKHRDRILQASMLIDHNADNVGPESNVEYVIRVYDDAENLVREVNGISVTSWAYTRSMMTEDLPNATGTVELFSRRDELDSWQKYRCPVILRVPGLGEALGENLGGGY